MGEDSPTEDQVHGVRDRARYGVLHVPRAAARPGDRRAVRRLQLRCRALRDARGTKAVSGGVGGGRHGRHSPPEPSEARRSGRGGITSAGADHRAVCPEEAGRPLRFRSRAGHRTRSRLGRRERWASGPVRGNGARASRVGAAPSGSRHGSRASGDRRGRGVGHLALAVGDAGRWSADHVAGGPAPQELLGRRLPGLPRGRNDGCVDRRPGPDPGSEGDLPDVDDAVPRHEEARSRDRAGAGSRGDPGGIRGAPGFPRPRHGAAHRCAAGPASLGQQLRTGDEGRPGAAEGGGERHLRRDPRPGHAPGKGATGRPADSGPRSVRGSPESACAPGARHHRKGVPLRGRAVQAGDTAGPALRAGLGGPGRGHVDAGGGRLRVRPSRIGAGGGQAGGGQSARAG